MPVRIAARINGACVVCWQREDCQTASDCLILSLRPKNCCWWGALGESDSSRDQLLAAAQAWYLILSVATLWAIWEGLQLHFAKLMETHDLGISRLEY